MVRPLRAPLTAVCLVAAVTCAADGAQAAPVLAAASAEVRFERADVCAVALRLTVTGTTTVEHRLEVRAGTSVELLGVEGATVSSPPRDLGRTRALALTTTPAPYTINYRVTQGPGWTHRCPLWLPTIPTDGRSRAVAVAVTLPAGATPGSTMPALSWSDATGRATLAHMPAALIVPFSGVGGSSPLDVARLMDVTAVASLVVGTGWWLRRRQAGRR